MTTESLTISMEELIRLKNRVLERGLKRVSVKSEYELMRIADGDIGIIIYKSGKVVHNGKKASMELLRTIFQWEEEYDFVLGSDETGKGEWYGPLVVEGVALTPAELNMFREMGVRDSKTISKKKLLDLGAKLVKLDFQRWPLILRPHKYNQLYAEFKDEEKTLNDMLAWAHATVIKDLLGQIKFIKAKAVIDKFDIKKTDSRLGRIDTTNVTIIQKSKGESEIPVAVASIIAKYIFEQEVDKLNRKYDVDLRNCNPGDIDPEILPSVAKIHFKNVKKFLE